MIRVGFSRRRGFAPLSWAIMAVEGTPYSHAYVKFYSKGMDRWLVYEATGAGVFFKALPVFESQVHVVEEYALETSDDHRTDLMRWAVDQSGRPYGRLQILGILIQRVARRLGISISNPFKNGESQWICNELVAGILARLGHPMAGDADSAGLKELKAHIRDLGLERI